MTSYLSFTTEEGFDNWLDRMTAIARQSRLCVQFFQAARATVADEAASASILWILLLEFHVKLILHPVDQKKLQ